MNDIACTPTPWLNSTDIDFSTQLFKMFPFLIYMYYKIGVPHLTYVL